jgi:hypothetical protein
MNRECVLFITDNIQSLTGHELLKGAQDNYNHEIYGDYPVSADAKEEFKKLLLQTNR